MELSIDYGFAHGQSFDFRAELYKDGNFNGDAPFAIAIKSRRRSDYRVRKRNEHEPARTSRESDNGGLGAGGAVAISKPVVF